MTPDGNVLTAENYYGQPNERMWPLRYIEGLNIILYPVFNKQKSVYWRLSTDAALISKVEQYVANWTGLLKGANFTPTNLLIVTWEDLYDKDWDSSKVCTNL